MKEIERENYMCVCVYKDIYVYIYVCAPRVRLCCCFVCTQRTNISLRTRVFPLLNKRKTAIFHMQRKKKCQQQHGEHLCCKGEPCRRQNAFTRAVVVVVRRPTKASFRLLSRRTRTRQKPCRFSFSYLQVCFVLYLI